MSRHSQKAVCPDCGFSCWGEATLARHRAVPHAPCPLCPGRSFIKLALHQRMKHSEVTPNTSSPAPATVKVAPEKLVKILATCQTCGTEDGLSHPHYLDTGEWVCDSCLRAGV